MNRNQWCKLQPGMTVKIVRPDDNDLRQGIAAGMEAVVVETMWSSSQVVRVKIPCISDEAVYVMEVKQVEVVKGCY